MASAEVLASVIIPEYPNRIFELVQYIVPAGIGTPVHWHPGMQIGKITNGVLTYTVVTGAAKIVRKNGSEEILEEGKSTQIFPGESLLEPEGMIHMGKNETDTNVVILASCFFEKDKPKTIVVSQEKAKL